MTRVHVWLWVGRLARWTLAAVFLYAGIVKVLEDPAAVAQQIRNYRLAPWWSVHPLAIVLPWVEIVAGLLLVPGIWATAAASLLAGLNVVFIAAVSWALHKELHIQCGCFGDDAMVSGAHVAGNAVLLGLALLAIASRRFQPQSDALV